MPILQKNQLWQTHNAFLQITDVEARKNSDTRVWFIFPNSGIIGNWDLEMTEIQFFQMIQDGLIWKIDTEPWIPNPNIN